jgi:hypothetical protein
MSCASAGNCGVGGHFFDRAGPTQPFVVTEQNGTWGRAGLHRPVSKQGLCRRSPAMRPPPRIGSSQPRHLRQSPCLLYVEGVDH